MITRKQYQTSYYLSRCYFTIAFLIYCAAAYGLVQIEFIMDDEMFSALSYFGMTAIYVYVFYFIPPIQRFLMNCEKTIKEYRNQ